jgi:hypothetical protein
VLAWQGFVRISAIRWPGLKILVSAVQSRPCPPLFPSSRASGHSHIVGGDFFDAVPAGGDAYMIKLVIHDWDDQRARQILRNCRSVMRAQAKLLVVDYVIGGQDEPDIGKFVDLEMLVLTSGGRERPEAEFRHLYDESGFELLRVVPTRSLRCVIEGMRR